MNINQFKSITQVQNEVRLQAPKVEKKPEGNSFQQALQNKLSSPELTFSKHALEQIQHRDIMDNVAYVVSGKNATVITALEAAETKNHVFTNIDGAVVL